MMYNNGFYPNTYQPYYTPNMPNNAQMQSQSANNGGIIWVQGEAGMKSFIVAPNSTVVLWDAENPTIYIKSADASGMPTTRTIDWVERTNNQKPPILPTPINNEPIQTADYVTREEFNTLAERLNYLSSQIGNSAPVPTGAKNTNKKEEKTNG